MARIARLFIALSLAFGLSACDGGLDFDLFGGGPSPSDRFVALEPADGVPARKSAKFDAARLLLCYFQAKSLQPVNEPILKVLCI